tara:strand:+ start:1062 stop:2096 length:1035 start_codon:yes stop_codon:yes gene_type:complete
MKKVVIIQNIIPHYRIALYNELSKYYNIIVIHSGDFDSSQKKIFKTIKLKSLKIGPFNFQKKLNSTIAEESPDAIISSFDITWPTSFFILFRNKSKMIWWGLDEGRSKISLYFKILISKLNCPVIFYHSSIMKKFLAFGLKKDICFVANNTFHIPDRIEAFKYSKKHLLFVGTIRKRKQLDLCIDAFIKVNNSLKDKINFIIIGDGPEKKILEKKIRISNNYDFINFVGQINDPAKLEDYYKHALASISYGQAGLSVLQSFAYGVPYITKTDTISGGEANNIIHDYNGKVVDNSLLCLEKELRKIMVDVNYAKKLGKNAFDYYSEYCSINNMAKGFVKAINTIT